MSCCRKMLFSNLCPLLQVFLHMMMNCRGAASFWRLGVFTDSCCAACQRKQCPHTELHRDMSYVTVGIQSSLWGRPMSHWKKDNPPLATFELFVHLSLKTCFTVHHLVSTAGILFHFLNQMYTTTLAWYRSKWHPVCHNCEGNVSKSSTKWLEIHCWNMWSLLLF